MIIRNLILASALLLTNFLYSCEDLAENPAMSEEEVAEGLREALKVGTDTAVTVLNKEDGYFKDELVKILLPPEAAPAIKNIKLIPGGQELIDDVILKINRAAEDAAPEAKTIFVNAITGMTISDAMSILKGADTAATHYLKSNTYDSLQVLFEPKIKTSLSKPLLLGESAESAYAKLINTYNDVVSAINNPFISYPLIEGNSLSEHTTKRALSGLFLKVSDEEKAIRTDVNARVNDILKKVFGDNN